QRQHGATVIGSDDVRHPRSAQYDACAVQHLWIVVHQQDRQGGNVWHGIGFSSLTGGRVREARVLLITARKSDQRTGALARLGRKAKSALVHADERGGDGQSEPCPPTLVLGGEEWIAQACEMLRRNPDPFIAYLKQHTTLDGVEGGSHGDPVT